MSTNPPRTRPVLTRDRIVSAAAELIDEQGLEALTMRAVAARLGSGVMSLYRHVSGHEELLDLVLAAMTAEVALPPATGDWRSDLRAAATTMRGALLRRPQLTVLLTSRSGRGGADLPFLDQVLGVLRDAGLPPRRAVLANHALGNLVAGAALWQAVGMGGTSGQARAEQRAAAQDAMDAAGEGFANVSWAGTELLGPDLDERFEAALDLLIAGIDAWLRAGGTP